MPVILIVNEVPMEMIQFFFSISIVLPVHAQLLMFGTLETELQEMEDYNNQSKPRHQNNYQISYMEYPSINVYLLNNFFVTMLQAGKKTPSFYFS